MNSGSEPTRLLADRRSLLKGAGAGLATLIAPGVALYAFGANDVGARPAGEPASTKVRWGILIDSNKCPPDCERCITACRDENGWKSTGRAESDAQWIRKVALRDPRSGAQRSAPGLAQCWHITGASFKRADGIVLVDKHICIGCRYCIMACPYKARSFVHEPIEDQKTNAPRGKGTVEACTLCVDRIDAGRKPACVEACASEGGGAMTFGDLNDPGSDIAKAVAALPTMQIRSDLGLDPGVRYRNL